MTRSVPKFGALCTIRRPPLCLLLAKVETGALLCFSALDRELDTLAWVSAPRTKIAQAKAEMRKILQMELFIRKLKARSNLPPLRL